MTASPNGVEECDMHVKRVIPCLDVRAGRVVKGTRFIDLRDAGDPVELAEHYDREGADELVFLDIDASHEGRSTMVDVVRKTAEKVFIPFTVGGGIRTVGDIRSLLRAGADRVSVNSAAVKDPGLIRRAADMFGSQCIVVAIDVRRKEEPGKAAPSWEVVINGGRVQTGLDVLEWVDRVQELGAGELLVTSMDTDGTRAGYDNALNAAIASRSSIPLIASGGAGELSHLRDAILEGCADAVLAASIFHFGQYSISEVKGYLRQCGIPVRIEEGLST
jgi:cyclase